MIRRLAVALAVALAVGSCGGTPAPETLTVAVASSLEQAMTEAGAAFERLDDRTQLVITSGSSAALRTQIEQGAPFDVFLSADTSNPQALADGGFAAGAPVPFAATTLVLVVPIGNPGRVAGPADLARPGVRLVTAADPVPLAEYAAEEIRRLAAQTSDPEAFESALGANIVSREENAAAVLARVELGEADAAFVYATDAARSARVTTIPIPEAANVRVVYAGVVVAGRPLARLGKDFLAWLAGDGGRTALRPYGFLAP